MYMEPGTRNDELFGTKERGMMNYWGIIKKDECLKIRMLYYTKLNYTNA